MTTPHVTPADTSDESPAQHTLAPTTRFTDRASDYVKYRPSYPASAIDAMLAGLGDPSRILAADFGAGTGISARLLADRGTRVIAIEPNAAMRDAATPHPRISWRDATAEATGLDDHSMDLVLCAQAFHWFNPPIALREFHRVLRPGGRLALMWNNLDTTDACSAAYKQTFTDAGGQYIGTQHDFDPQALRDSAMFADVRTEEFPGNQRLDAQGLIGRAMSASYAPKHGPGAERLRESLLALHARYAQSDGRVTLRYLARVHLGTAV